MKTPYRTLPLARQALNSFSGQVIIDLSMSICHPAHSAKFCTLEEQGKLPQ
jgi:hypothetical protein